MCLLGADPWPKFGDDDPYIDDHSAPAPMEIPTQASPPPALPPRVKKKARMLTATEIVHI